MARIRPIRQWPVVRRSTCPTSKLLFDPAPGHPQRLNSLPISIAVSPDAHYVVTINAGYGTFESGYKQSLAVLDTRTGALQDFPDDRTLAGSAKQTLYSGLAFSPRRQAPLRQHGIADQSHRRRARQHRQRGHRLQLRSRDRQDLPAARQGRPDPAAAAAARPRPPHPPRRRRRKATRACPFPPPSRRSTSPARRSSSSPATCPTMCC